MSIPLSFFFPSWVKNCQIYSNVFPMSLSVLFFLLLHRVNTLWVWYQQQRKCCLCNLLLLSVPSGLYPISLPSDRSLGTSQGPLLLRNCAKSMECSVRRMQESAWNHHYSTDWEEKPLLGLTLMILHLNQKSLS